jgi:hypothetical protein
MTMWIRKELKERAKLSLRETYWKAFLVSIIIAIVGGSGGGPGSFNYNAGGNGSSNFTSEIMGNESAMLFIVIIAIVVFIIVLFMLSFRIFLGYPLEVGGKRYFKQAAEQWADLNNIGFAFEKSKYMDIVKAMLWRGILNTLWYLLFLIPGFVKMYSYSMVPYILGDNPNLGRKRALELSRHMARGHKFRMFVLDLSFIGWFLLGMLALVVGVLFVLPYVNATKAELYLTLREIALNEGICSYEELRLTDPHS